MELRVGMKYYFTQMHKQALKYDTVVEILGNGNVVVLGYYSTTSKKKTKIELPYSDILYKINQFGLHKSTITRGDI